MPKFQVCSGSVKVTILANDPRDAAVELLQSQGAATWEDGGDSHRRRGLGEQILVAEPGARQPPERFITFDLLAYLNGQTPRAAWRKVLADFDPNNN
jgi:hypothetical protein